MDVNWSHVICCLIEQMGYYMDVDWFLDEDLFCTWISFV